MERKKETLRGIWLQPPLRMQPQGRRIAVDGSVQKACRHGLLVWESKGNHHIHEGRAEGEWSVTGLPLSLFLQSTPTSAPSYTFNFSSSFCDLLLRVEWTCSGTSFCIWACDASRSTPTVEERTVLALQSEPVRISTLGLISI